MNIFTLFIFYILLSAYNVINADHLGIRHCITPGLVALTFDDGPSLNGETENLLKVLKKENVKATFFVTGSVDNNRDHEPLEMSTRKHNLLRQIFTEGHQIGSHSWSHSNISTLTIQKTREDISQLANFVRNAVGINMTVFRAPYGASNKDTMKTVQDEFGYKLIFWSINTSDWRHNGDIKSGFSNYKKTIGSSKTNSYITIHHDPMPKTGELAKMAIDFVRSKGFKLVTVGECIGIKNYVKV